MILAQTKNILLSGWLAHLKAASKVGQRGVSGSVGLGNTAWITATPRVCLHDVPTTLTAGGLAPHHPVTLSATLNDEKGKEFCSCAHYVTDGNGNIDTRTAESVGGSYEGVFAAGLLSTLTPAPHEYQYLRLYRRDTSIPWKIQVSVLDDHQPLGTKVEALAKVEMERHLMALGVRRLPVREGKVRGTLYLPPGNGPFPGVIDMFGFVGGLMEFRSAMLASRGFASMALAFIAYDGLPATLDDLDLSYFEDAVEILLSVPEVIPDRCGAIGNSKSGDFLLSMAALIPSVKAVVGVNCSTVSLESDLTYKGKLFRKKSDFSLDRFIKTKQDSLAVTLEPVFTIDNPSMIPVEEADDETHFLLVAGEDDPWGFKHSLEQFKGRMLMHNKHNFETVLYRGTGHLIEPPYNPLIKHSFHRHYSGKSIKALTMEWGGDPKPMCIAQEDLWRRMQTFWMTHVRDKSTWYQDQLTRQAQNSSKL